MGIFSFFRPRGRAVSAPVPEKPARPTKTASLVFVDIPNVINRQKESARLVRWDQFRYKIDTLTKGTERLFAGAYHEDDEHRAYRPLKSDEIAPDFTAHGYVFTSYPKSIDILIGSDMWDQTISVVASQSYAKIRFILVSGDADFVWPIERIRKRFGSAIKIELFVVAWNGSLGNGLRAEADRVVMLDNVPRILNTKKMLPAASP